MNIPNSKKSRVVIIGGGFAGIALAKTEGIIPAIESAHALAVLHKKKFKPEDVVVINLSGRGDKDLNTYINYFNL